MFLHWESCPALVAREEQARYNLVYNFTCYKCHVLLGLCARAQRCCAALWLADSVAALWSAFAVVLGRPMPQPVGWLMVGSAAGVCICVCLCVQVCHVLPRCYAHRA